MPFRLSPSLDGSPDRIIVDRDENEVGDLYTSWEEASEIVDAINSGLNPAADLAKAIVAGAALTRGL